VPGRKYERCVVPKGKAKVQRPYEREERAGGVPVSRRKIDLFLKERNRIVLDSVTAATERPRQYMEDPVEDMDGHDIQAISETDELLLSDCDEYEDPDSAEED
jgi:hypothetical protein